MCIASMYSLYVYSLYVYSHYMYSLYVYSLYVQPLTTASNYSICSLYMCIALLVV